LPQLAEAPVLEQPQSNQEDMPNFPLPYKKKKVEWPASLFIVGIHIAALAAFFTYNWPAFGVCIILHWVTGGLGITLGYHRLLTHRSFKVPKLLEYFLAFIGSLACQSGPITWVVVHRIHHAESDDEWDPHSPVQGFFWAHMGWCLSQNKMIDDPAIKAKYAPDLVRDPVHRFLNQYNILGTLLLAAGLYAWGGWPFVVWGVFVRLVLVYHCTWLVNSAAHIWGYQTYFTGDQSTNLWWVALMSYGEGWHNNHHAFQYSARHGLKWWEFDSTYLMIKLLKVLGLATAVKTPSKQLLASSRASGRQGMT